MKCNCGAIVLVSLNNHYPICDTCASVHQDIMEDLEEPTGLLDSPYWINEPQDPEEDY